MSSLNSRPALPIFGLGCSCWAPCAMASGAPLILGTRLLETSIRRNLLKHACGNSFPAEFGSVQQPQSHPNARRAVGNYQRRQSLKKCGIICEQKVVAGGGGGFCFSERLRPQARCTSRLQHQGPRRLLTRAAHVLQGGRQPYRLTYRRLARRTSCVRF